MLSVRSVVVLFFKDLKYGNVLPCSKENSSNVLSYTSNAILAGEIQQCSKFQSCIHHCKHDIFMPWFFKHEENFF